MDPLEFTREIIEIKDNGQEESFAYCTSEDWQYFVAPLAVMLFCSICYGIYLLYAIWFIPSDFNESKWISFSLVTAFEALIVAIPLLFLASNDPTVRFLVLFFVCISTMFIPVLFLMLPKIAEVKDMKTSFYNDSSSITGRRVGGSQSSLSFSNTDERRYGFTPSEKNSQNSRPAKKLTMDERMQRRKIDKGDDPNGFV